jgi:autotransporter-associated beta strand protein
LNGSGPTTGPFAAFPGAIRQDTNIAVTINNAVVLQSAALLHVQGSASGVLTFPNVISGVGSLTLTAPAHDANLGSLVLNGANTYSGGTIVNGGTIQLSGATASLGLGDVMVISASAVTAGSSGRILIDPGVLNAIADSAKLTLAGGNVAGAADDGFIVLSSGVNETVGSLVLGGVAQVPGTYGSTASTATFKSDEYFSGTGVVTVVPEPSAALVVIAGIGVLAAKRRRR